MLWVPSLLQCLVKSEKSMKKGKGINWKKLVMFSRSDLLGLDSVALDPAIKITFAWFGPNEARFSYTLGITEEDGTFRSVQHINHRRLRTYMDLLNVGQAVVDFASGFGHLEVLAENPYTIKHTLSGIFKDVKGENPVSEPLGKKSTNRPKVYLKKPDFGASIGEMIKSKKNQG